jgi:hypothetical protein
MQDRFRQHDYWERRSGVISSPMAKPLPSATVDSKLAACHSKPPCALRQTARLIEVLAISRTALRAKLRSLGMAIEKQLLPESEQIDQ